jgi:hypothetical protein
MVMLLSVSYLRLFQRTKFLYILYEQSRKSVLFLAHLAKGNTSPWHHLASVIVRHCQWTIHILIFFSRTTGQIWIKFGRDGSWVVPFQNCIREVRHPSKMATVTKNRKYFKCIKHFRFNAEYVSNMNVAAWWWVV